MSTRTGPVASIFRLIDLWRFRLLLALLFAALFLGWILNRTTLGSMTETLLFGVILSGAVSVSRAPRAAALATHALVVVWVLLSLAREAGLVAPLDAPLLAITLVLGITVFAFTLYALLTTPQIDIDSLAGAVFGYFLLAVIWALFYVQVEIWSPGSFVFPAQSQDLVGELLYFSLVTITTLGYGDITATNQFARICTGIEAAQGTLYLAILIGRVVATMRSRDERD
jgi:Ion channel